MMWVTGLFQLEVGTLSWLLPLHLGIQSNFIHIVHLIRSVETLMISSYKFAMTFDEYLKVHGLSNGVEL